MAAGLTGNTEGLGAVGGYKDLAKYTTLGGSLFVFALPGNASDSCEDCEGLIPLRRLAPLLAIAWMAGSAGADEADPQAAAPADAPYTVVDGTKVDAKTLDGLEDLARARLRALPRRRAGRPGRAVAGRDAQDAEEGGIPRPDA